MSVDGERPIVGISVGDPAGIGPEVCARALALPRIHGIARALVLGDLGLMREAVRLCGLGLEVRAAASPAAGSYREGVIDVLQTGGVDLRELRRGVVSPLAGKASFECVRAVIELALAGRIHATVTGPINKEAINAAGFHYAGHTEIYGALTGSRDYAMMLVDGEFRVVHVSTHCSLREACERARTPRVLTVIELAHRALLRLGIDRPRIAVAGLNPHAGEAGLFGREEIEEIAPAVREAASRGIGASGPYPADTLFSKLAGGLYDIVVAMYHDQGHIPAKLRSFRYDSASDGWLSMSGVNVTLGLPIVRTSVDHGTAFDRAWKGTANPDSMVQAIEMAVRLA